MVMQATVPPPEVLLCIYNVPTVLLEKPLENYVNYVNKTFINY